MLPSSSQSVSKVHQTTGIVTDSLKGSDRHPNPNIEHPSRAAAQPPFPMIKEQEFPGIEAAMNPRPDFGEHTYKGSEKLNGKIALITGGDSGIGRAVAIAFAREGANVAISYLNEEEDAKETSIWIEKAGKECLLLPGDISEEEQCKKIVDNTIKKFGRLDILINNAAYQPKAATTFEELSRERVEYVFKTNIISMFSITKYSLVHMKEGGCIINTCSIQAYRPSHPILDYACTKSAVVNFTKGLAQELASRGIRVNAVAPGPVWTPLVAASFSKEKLMNFGSHYPIGRPAQPGELAPSYVFLASSESRYINATILSVTGGMPTM